jgi:hypothetical protein
MCCIGFRYVDYPFSLKILPSTPIEFIRTGWCPMVPNQAFRLKAFRPKAGVANTSA